MKYPTPTAQDSKNNGGDSQFARNTLPLNAYVKKFPTPRVSGQECYETRAKRKGHDCALSYLESYVDYIENYKYPTPVTHGMYGGSSDLTKKLADAGIISGDERRAMRAGNGGALNPDWVELLMGWPLGWTSFSPMVKEDVKAWADSNTSWDLSGRWISGDWESGVARIALGVEHRHNRLRCIGNGQVPIAAAVAFSVLRGRLEGVA